MSRPEIKRKVRCAVYTRKSSEEGLEQDFNSLDAQREACAAYIDSQRHEGWLALDDRYDDGGYSGGTLERPALQRLIRRHRGRQGRHRRLLQDRPAVALAHRLCQAGRRVRAEQRHLRFGDAVILHHDVDGQVDA